MINERLASALDRITVHPGGLTATVGERELAADNRRDLRNQLCLTLYRDLHSGSAAPAEQSALMPRQTRDPAFEEMLRAAVPHRYGPGSGLVLAVDDDGPETRVVVQLPEITASVPQDRLAGDRTPVVGETVRVLLDCRRPNVSPGFYYVIGSRTFGTAVLGLRRIFVHLTEPGEAVETFRGLLCRLEDAGLRYHAKILSARTAYPRRDGIVVYLPDTADEVERDIALGIAARPGLGAETSVFTEQIAPGVSRADDPVDDRAGQSGLSFGQHRSLALATALTRHAADPSLLTREQSVVEVFREARIDPLEPARNLQLENADV